MTQEAALHQFFSGFGFDAYASSEVPDGVAFPYLTYDLVTDDWLGGERSITVNLWFYTSSESVPNAKARELYNALGLGGLMLPYDGGAIWLKRGSPWCQSMTDQNDTNIKRRYINVTAEFLCA